jgi:hypothetical protein
MDSKQKVNELIDIIEKKCHEICLCDEVRGIFKLDLNDNIYLVYNEGIGLTMFYGKVWYTDEERIERLTKVVLPNMRDKIIKLITETDSLNMKDLERVAFELS